MTAPNKQKKTNPNDKGEGNIMFVLFILVLIPAAASIAIFNLAGSRRVAAYSRN